MGCRGIGTGGRHPRGIGVVEFLPRTGDGGIRVGARLFGILVD
jgi:hypothetical protein